MENENERIARVLRERVDAALKPMYASGFTNTSARVREGLVGDFSMLEKLEAKRRFWEEFKKDREDELSYIGGGETEVDLARDFIADLDEMIAHIKG